jgi:DNA mismatch repair protein MutS2
VGRSSSGFFYVVPSSIDTLKADETRLGREREEIIYEYTKKISSIFQKWLKFISYSNKEFDRIDHFIARVRFAKTYNYEFCPPSKQGDIVLKNFCHPALHNPKPISVDFRKKLLMITGVNAGGKTMALKSILSAALLSKYLLPMRIDANNSTLASFKEIIPIIDDPQNVSNDISTFAGRMVEFSKLFSKEHFIVGVDEIELGTDSDEAAALFKVILDRLLAKNCKVIITTHHKKLASLMAKEPECELSAALYDEKERKPQYDFLSGTIGKSYAFETAQRYGIPTDIIHYAKETYANDSEKLGDLIQKNIDLELKLRQKEERLEKSFAEVNTLKKRLHDEKKRLTQEIQQERNQYETAYKKAIEVAKNAAKQNASNMIHKELDLAHKIKNRITDIDTPVDTDLTIGDRVKYGNTKGSVIALKQHEATIESDEGMKLRVPIKELKKSTLPKRKKPKNLPQSNRYDKPTEASIKLDLHGKRREEALEELDKFLSDALLSGFEEILVYHGIGAGILARSVREFLKKHPKVLSYSDAPANLGGFGATIIKL